MPTKYAFESLAIGQCLEFTGKRAWNAGRAAANYYASKHPGWRFKTLTGPGTPDVMKIFRLADDPGTCVSTWSVSDDLRRIPDLRTFAEALRWAEHLERLAEGGPTSITLTRSAQ